MTRKIFSSIIIVSLITFILCVVIMTGVSCKYFNDKLFDELENEVTYVAAGVNSGGTTYLSSLPNSNRITLTDASGAVVFDTEAHGGDDVPSSVGTGGEEVRAALESGDGKPVRYTERASGNTLYCAKRLSDGSVLRVSRQGYTFLSVLGVMFSPSVILLALLVAFSVCLAVAMSRSIVKPINSIDIENPDPDKVYPELSLLLRKISRQNGLIRRQLADLRQKQEEFSTITRYMSEGLIVVGEKGEILSYNNSALLQLGVQGKNPGTDIFSLISDEGFAKTVKEALDGAKGSYMFSENGRTHQLFANPVRYNKKTGGAVLLILDITEREQNEALRREFTSNVSHELKTPLTTIYGVAELLISGMVKPEDTQKFVKTIHGESGRMISLVDDIIKLSRLDEKSFSEEKEPCDLYKIAAEVAERLGVAAQSRGVSLCLEGESATVFGIRTILSEMIYNLCDNAIKYNKENGSVVIRVTAGEHPQVSVADTGIGISPEHVGRIFERFYRVDKSHSRAIGGTGLGLSIVKHGAAYHNAQVSVESRVGEGSVITVTF